MHLGGYDVGRKKVKYCMRIAIEIIDLLKILVVVVNFWFKGNGELVAEIFFMDVPLRFYLLHLYPYLPNYV